MVDAKVYGFVNLKVKKDVAEKIQELTNEHDITISDLLISVLDDKTTITVILEAKKRRKYEHNNMLG